MFLDKLWLRIKGELIILREDLSAGADLREKASLLLDKLEQRLDLSDSDTQAQQRERPAGRSAEQAPESDSADSRSLDDIQREWQELVKLRGETKGRDDETEPPPPNPRTLG